VSDAIERLRQIAQNEHTTVALADALRWRDAELKALRTRVKELQRENSDLQWRIARLAQTAEDLYHQVDEWKRAAKGEK
jgi:predicted RNase H-like nuclease (RuvC/YqgF family)